MYISIIHLRPGELATGFVNTDRRTTVSKTKIRILFNTGPPMALMGGAMAILPLCQLVQSFQIISQCFSTPLSPVYSHLREGPESLWRRIREIITINSCCSNSTHFASDGYMLPFCLYYLRIPLSPLLLGSLIVEQPWTPEEATIDLSDPNASFTSIFLTALTECLLDKHS